MKFIEKPGTPREPDNLLFYCIKRDNGKVGGYVSNNSIILTNGETLETKDILNDDNSYVGLDPNMLLKTLEVGECSSIEQICLSGMLKYCKDNCNKYNIDETYENLFVGSYVPSRANCLYNTKNCNGLKIKYFYNHLLFMDDIYLIKKLSIGKLSKDEQVTLYEKLKDSMDKFKTFILNFWQVECAVAKKYYSKTLAEKILNFNIMDFIEPFKELHSIMFKDAGTQNKIFCMDPDDKIYTRTDTTLLMPYVLVLAEDTTNKRLMIGKYYDDCFLTVNNSKYLVNSVRPWQIISVFDMIDEVINKNLIWIDEAIVLSDFFNYREEGMFFLEDQGLPISHEDFIEFGNYLKCNNEESIDKCFKELLRICKESLMKFKARLNKNKDIDICNYTVQLMLNEFAELAYYIYGENWMDNFISEDSKIMSNYLEELSLVWGIDKDSISKKELNEISNFIFQISSPSNDDSLGFLEYETDEDILLTPINGEIPLTAVCGGEPREIDKLGITMINNIPYYEGTPINGFQFSKIFK